MVEGRPSSPGIHQTEKVLSLIERSFQQTLQQESYENVSRFLGLFKKLDQEIWKLKEYAYTSCVSEEQQKIALADLKESQEKQKKLKESLRQLQLLEKAHLATQKKKLLTLERDSAKQDQLQSQKDLLYAERAVTESYKGMIQMLRREMEQGNSVLERLEQSSKQLGDTVGEHNAISDNLVNASNLLSRIRNRAFLEKVYLVFSTLFFTFVVCLAFKQRIIG